MWRNCISGDTQPLPLLAGQGDLTGVSRVGGLSTPLKRYRFRSLAYFRAEGGPGQAGGGRGEVGGAGRALGQCSPPGCGGPGRGGVRREAGPARHPYPRLGPLGTNQGPAMPMRPQNVVKMTTGRAKECAVMASAGRPGRAQPLRSAGSGAGGGPRAHWSRACACARARHAGAGAGPAPPGARSR